ncbi:MAG: hypothetical protein MZU97_24410 [Bacillus subtilis]|nr:hypothetical protein [Bacillus subtilis]
MASNVVPEELVYVSSDDDFLFVTVGAGWVVTGDYWYYTDDPLILGPNYVLAPETGLFTLLSSVYLNGETTNIDFADEIVLDSHHRRSQTIRQRHLVRTGRH